MGEADEHRDTESDKGQGQDDHKPLIHLGDLGVMGDVHYNLSFWLLSKGAQFEPRYILAQQLGKSVKIRYNKP